MYSCVIAVTNVMMRSVISVQIVAVVIIIYAMPMSVISRVISPIIRRIPNRIIRTPKPTVNNRCVDINRLYNIVVAINIRIADNLNNGFIVLFCNNQRGNVLKNISCQDRLNDNDMSILVWYFQYPEVINLPIIVQIKV